MKDIINLPIIQGVGSFFNETIIYGNLLGCRKLYGRINPERSEGSLRRCNGF